LGPRRIAAEAWTRRIAAGGGLALALLACATCPPRAGAAQFLHVTTTADESDGTCTALKCTLRDAIEAPGEENVVEVPASPTPYELTLGDLVIDHPLAIKGEGARRTVISGGGHHRVFTVKTSGSVTLLGLRVTAGNGASSIDEGVGGGIYQAEGSLFLEDVSVDHNAAAPSLFDTISGGGIDSNGEELVIVDSTVADNRAVGESVPQANQFGGGVDAEFGPAVSVLDSTITGNEAGGDGGGIATNGEATLEGATIARNVARGGDGGGIEGATTLHAANTIIALNTADGSEQDCGTTPTGGEVSNNLSGDSSCAFTATGDQQDVTEPLLGQLADNGGETDTLALLPGSPAIDAGSSFGCLGHDQRGVTRPTGPRCDIGAFEFDGPRNLTAPAIVGYSETLLVSGGGTTLTAQQGVWSEFATFTYQWQLCDATGAGCTDIAGATEARYTVTPAQAGHTLRVRVTATDSSGNSGEALSAPTALVIAYTGGGAVAEPPHGVRAYSAELSGTVVPPASESYSVYFEYGPTSAYGLRTGGYSDPLQGNGIYTIATAAFTQPGSTYHYRLVLEGATRTTSPDMTFTTPATTLRGGCSSGIHTRGASYSYELCNAPDLDQVRLGELPNDGQMFCVPTATTDLMADLATNDRGLPPGPVDFTQPANFAAGSAAIRRMGTDMGTDGKNGTNEEGFLAGLRTWLAGAGSAANGLTYQDINKGSGGGLPLEELVQAATSGGMVLVNIGFFDVNGNRTGGHEVFMTGLSGTSGQPTATLDLSDPYTSALPDDLQSPYAADELHVRMSSIGGSKAPQGEYPVLQGYAYEWGGITDAIDDIVVIRPQVYASGAPGRVVFASAQSLVPGAPVERAFSVPGSPISVELAPDGSLNYLTTSATRAGAARAAARGGGELVSFNPVTHRAHVLVRNLRAPRALVIGGRAQLRYVLDARGITAYDAAGHVRARTALRGATHASLAWDAHAGDLGVVSSATGRLALLGPTLKAVLERPLPKRLTHGHPQLDLAFAPNGSAVLHRRGSLGFTVLGRPGGAHSASRRATAARAVLGRASGRAFRAGGKVTGFAVDSAGHVLITVGGTVRAFNLAGRPVSLSLPSGLPGATNLAVLSNVDPLAPGERGLTLDQLMPALATSANGPGITRVG